MKQSGTTQYRYSPTHAPTAYSRAYCLLTRLLLTYAPTALLTRLLPYSRAYCLTGAGAKASVAALPSAVKSTLTRKYNQAP